MLLEKIKKEVTNHIGDKAVIKCNLGRNKYEYYEGIIKKIHQNLFTVDTNKGLKSFTYADVVTKTVVLTKFNS